MITDPIFYRLFETGPETIIMYKVPKLSREEIKTMLHLHDIRESRAWQEAKEEGLKEGMGKGVAIARLAAEKKSVAEIAALLKMDVELVRQVLAQVDRD